MPMSIQMDIIKEAAEKNERLEKFSESEEAIVIEAYDTPRYTAEDMKKRAIEDLRDSVYLSCIKECQAATLKGKSWPARVFIHR